MSKVGEIIAGRYQLESELGEGGSASVMRAVDLTLQKTVAIKILYSADERHQDRQVELFLREARLACAVHHPNVAQTLDFGVTGTGRAFMIMELLEGEDLGMRMDRTPPLTLQEIVELVSGVLRGLGAIHDAGIVHRDVKPENVFLISTGGAV
ncbi:MAG TPA: serine/threonine-protein kinase, partial [Polyangiales bacterium]|nr:serine/threonine-protein kinase [Polyangiales bacterium]